MPHDPALLAALAPGQHTDQAEQPLPRRQLGRFTLGLLIALRVYIVIAVPVVGYAFLHALATAP